MGDRKEEEVVDDLPDPDVKVILLGDSAVGKSKLVERFLMDEYNPRQLSVRQSEILFATIKSCFLSNICHPTRYCRLMP